MRIFAAVLILSCSQCRSWPPYISAAIQCTHPYPFHCIWECNPQWRWKMRYWQCSQGPLSGSDLPQNVAGAVGPSVVVQQLYLDLVVWSSDWAGVYATVGVGTYIHPEEVVGRNTAADPVVVEVAEYSFLCWCWRGTHVILLCLGLLCLVLPLPVLVLKSLLFLFMGQIWQISSLTLLGVAGSWSTGSIWGLTIGSWRSS